VDDNGSPFAAYDCTIAGTDGELAASSLKVFQPGDFDAFMKQAVMQHDPTCGYGFEPRHRRAIARRLARADLP
jgi:hypothetical protein